TMTEWELQVEHGIRIIRVNSRILQNNVLLKEKLMKHGILLLLLICAGCTRCHAQGENNIWIAARNIGLDFRSGTPQSFSLIPEVDDMAAAICERNGSLLFFSDGVFVRDRNQQVMPNGMLEQRG